MKTAIRIQEEDLLQPQVRDHMIREANLKKIEIWENTTKMHQIFQNVALKKAKNQPK